jgi:hypothetical protein
MINGGHIIVSGKDAEADRAFSRTSSLSLRSMPVAAG